MFAYAHSRDASATANAVTVCPKNVAPRPPSAPLSAPSYRDGFSRSARSDDFAAVRHDRRAFRGQIVDEADTFLGQSQQLRGIINGSYNPATAHVYRDPGLQPPALTASRTLGPSYDLAGGENRWGLMLRLQWRPKSFGEYRSLLRCFRIFGACSEEVGLRRA